MMNGRKKSDPVIVAGKPTNKAAKVAAEPVEKDGGQGECEPAKHAPDTVPETRVTGAGAHTASSPSHTQGGSRVREFRSHGSVRGAAGNSRPYRDDIPLNQS